MNEVSPSFEKAAWQRLKKNKAAMAGLILIVIAIFISVFGYWIAPDASPFANRMILETGGRKPGFQQKFLLFKRDRNVAEKSFFSRLLNGQEDAYEYIPVRNVAFHMDTVIYEKYIDEEVYETERRSFINSIYIPLTDTGVQSLQQQFKAHNIIIKKFYLGTDKYGRDMLSRLIIGTRVSLSVGLITVIISLTVGILLGALAGYFRGVTDEVIMWLINIIWSIPTLLLVFAVTLLLGKGFWQVFIAVGLTMWVNVARLVRGQVLAARQLQYVEAARALGFSDVRIIAYHILPNILGPILVIAASNFASAIVIEAGLSFLGIGVQPPQPSWGLMIKENYNFIITQNPMLALAPGFAIMLLVMAFNLLGNGLRDALNVRGRI